MSYCKSHKEISLYDLQRNLGKLYHVPTWQRADDAWPEAKRKAFNTIVLEKASRGRDTLSGDVTIYTTETDPHTEYISDGYQRASQSRRLYTQLEHTHGREKAEEILSKITIPISYRVYVDEAEAKKEFRLMNLGTSLTPKEEAKSALTELQNYPDWETRIFNPLHKGMIGIRSQAKIKAKKSRIQQHRMQRDDFALLLRYLIKDTELSVYETNTKDINNFGLNDYGEGTLLEVRLQKVLQGLGIDQTEKQLRYFLQFMEQGGSHISAIWDSVDKSKWEKEQKSMTEMYFRNLLHLHIWRANTNTPVATADEYMHKLSEHSKGVSMAIFGVDGEYKYKTLSLGNLRGLKSAQKLVGVILDPNDQPRKRKRRSTKQVPPGEHISHIQSVAIHGDTGDVVCVSATKNMSMGTQNLA